MSNTRRRGDQDKIMWNFMGLGFWPQPPPPILHLPPMPHHHHPTLFGFFSGIAYLLTTVLILLRNRSLTLATLLKWKCISFTFYCFGPVTQQHLQFSSTSHIYFSNKKVLLTMLNRAIGLLSKIRHSTPKSLLKTIYFSLFNSHLIYACQIWGQSKIKLFKR